MTGSEGEGFAQFANPGQLPKLNSIFDVSAKFLGELRLWLELNPPAIGISNILGFSQFTAHTAAVANADTRTSSTYGDPAHAGPTIAGLPNGNYLLIWGGAAAGNPTVSSAEMAVQINSGSVPGGTNQNVALTGSLSATAVVAADTAILNGGSNTVTVKYASSDNASTASFSNRWLIALRFSNL